MRYASRIRRFISATAAPRPVNSGFEIDGGALQKGEEHTYLVEIVTPTHIGGPDKKPLCKVKMLCYHENKQKEIQGDPPIIEYTTDEDLIRKSDHPEIERYKAMYTAFIQTQRAVQDIRAGKDPKKTQMLLQNAAKTTRKLGLSKQTKQLETLSDKVVGNDITEDDIIATSVGSKKTRVLDK